MNSPIRWGYITRALEYYQKAGFEYIEAPWVVSQEAVDVTLPTGRRGVHTEDGALVGSAEQSFIDLMLNAQLQANHPYMAATPCFRDDPVDRLHQRHFFKVELFILLGPFEKDAAKLLEPAWTDVMLRFAKDFFTSIGPEPYTAYTPEGADLELNGVEIGSYGVRNYRGQYWAYGTGIAEPRYSTVAG